ncbi:amidase domain-containing protein [Brevibacillus sp. NRS-1366]|uniref:amidase domain-containing protein n=1 Tax=Brevibacillus sp. NRS-1366 TaxID=3233899 RepID=UPI003D1B7F19
MKKAKFALFAALSLTLGFSVVPTQVLAAKSEVSEKQFTPELREAIDNFFKEREKAINNGDISSLPFDKNDETSVYLQYIIDVENFEVTDYRVSYDIKDVTENKDNYEVDIYLIQEFVVNDSIESGFADDVKIILTKPATSLNKNSLLKNSHGTSEGFEIVKMSSDTLETDTSSDDIIEKGKDFKAQLKKQSAKKQNSQKQAASKAPQTAALASYSYDGSDAADYALDYALSPNPDYYYWNNDCTNFVSQALNYGGIPERGTTSGNYKKWFYRDRWDVSNSWINVDDFYEVATNSYTIFGSELDYASELRLGDVVQYDIDSDGDWNHTAIVTKLTNNGRYDIPLVSYHSSNRKNVAWDYFVSKYDECDYRLIDIHE